MFGNLFKKKQKPIVTKPSIMGLAVGTSFEIDTLGITLIIDKLTIESISKTQIIKSAGKVEADGNVVLRFYTDDEAWLQVVCEGEEKEENIISVKLFHYYDTLGVDSQYAWDELLKRKLGQPTYKLDDKEYDIVWRSSEYYSSPVHFHEICFDESDEPSETDQFVMLYERKVDDSTFESLFLSAEEIENEHGNLERCFVISTGIDLTPAQIKINA